MFDSLLGADADTAITAGSHRQSQGDQLMGLGIQMASLGSCAVYLRQSTHNIWTLFRVIVRPHFVLLRYERIIDLY